MVNYIFIIIGVMVTIALIVFLDAVRGTGAIFEPEDKDVLFDMWKPVAPLVVHLTWISLALIFGFMWSKRIG